MMNIVFVTHIFAKKMVPAFRHIVWQAPVR